MGRNKERAMHSLTLGVLSYLLLLILSREAAAQSTERPKTANVCVIHLIGNANKKGAEATFKHVSFSCTGEKLPVSIRVHRFILDAVNEKEGVELKTDADVRGLIQFEDTLSLTILNSVFEHLDCGGLIPVVFDKSAGLFYNATFSGNKNCRCGGIYAAGRSLMHVYDSSFTDNVGHSHGAVFATGAAKVKFINTVFRSNTGGTSPEGDGFASGAVFAHQSTLAEFEKCEFVDNVAKGSGAGAFKGLKRSVFKCTDCLIQNNSGEYGAVSLTDICTGTLIRTKFVDNEATGDGAAITLALRSDITINGCRFEVNRGASGAILAYNGKAVNIQSSDFHDNVGLSFGGAVSVVVGGEVVMQGCTSATNTGKFGGVVYQDHVKAAMFKECVFSNNIGHLTGGAIYQKDCGDTMISACEFVKNDGGMVGGGVSQTGCGEVEWLDATMQDMVKCHPGDQSVCDKVFITGCKFEGNKAMEHASSIFQDRCKNVSITSTTFPKGEMSIVQERCSQRTFEDNTSSKSAVYVKDCPKGTKGSRRLMVQ